MNIYFIGMCISLVCYIVIGILISKKVKSANDFYVAGRNAPVLLIAGSMIASYASTGMFMGDAGEYYSGLFSPMTILATMQVAGYLYGAIFFGRYLRRSEVYTIPEFFGKRFCSEKMRNLATITAIITMVVYLLSVIQGIGTLMSTVTGVDYNICIVLSLLTFLVVCVSSGSSGVLITDTIMFGIFTLTIVVATFFITSKAGGWYAAAEKLQELGKGLLSGGGNPDYMYPSAAENISWGIVYGIVWMSVCMVGPWQSSRYLMAKNEHTVIRSSVCSAVGIFVLQLLVGISAVTINLFNPNMESPSQVLIWASMNVLPTFLGVVLLTGVLAAGISSATTFLSLIGSSVANDILKNSKNKIRVGQIAMIIVGIIVLVLAVFNPPQIFWLVFFGGAIVASSWMPVAIASIISKRVTKAGAFCGMLSGFVGCFAMKLFNNFSGIVLPVWLDATIVGIVLNLITLIIVSALTKVTDEEKEAREKLFVIPESEKSPKDIKVTKNYLKVAIALGAVVFAVLFFSWVLPISLH